MIDIKLLRQHPDTVLENVQKRYMETEPVKDLIHYDKRWRELSNKVNELRHKRNVVSEEIKNLTGSEKVGKIKEMKYLVSELKNIEIELKSCAARRDELLLITPNIIHDSVPIGEIEDHNVEVKRWGKIPDFDFKVKNHIELGKELNLFDTEKAADVSGARFYYLKNEAVLLDLALTQYALDVLKKHNYKLMMPPVLVREKVLEGAGFLPKYKEDVYKIENKDLFLVGTSEQSLAAYHMNEVFEEDDLPIYYAGYSPCYRTEAGAHGKDTKGIFRVHHFNKVEQFKFCTPETSWEEHEKMQKVVEELVEGLGLPYRVVNVCSGELGLIAAKKYDTEIWLPGQGKYRELTSNSNCTDYQARRLNIKYIRKSDGKRVFVHTLNSTALAIERALIGVMEIYQQKDGSIDIPSALRKYTHGLERIERHR